MTELVKEFHEAFGLPVEEYPSVVPDPELVRLRARLIKEEYEEVMAEFAALGTVKYRKHETVVEDTARLLKELADLQYVIQGAAVSLGLPLDEAFAEVHRSNMTKLGEDGKPIYRESDGKVLKGPNYEPANITKLLQLWAFDTTAEECE